MKYRCAHCGKTNDKPTGAVNRAAAGRHIPLVVENVRGAQKWVGRARWSHGSFYLWGDVPALMPIVLRAAKNPGQNWSNFNKTGEVSPHWNVSAIKNSGGSWFNIAHNTTSGKGRNPDGRKNEVGGSWFGSYAEQKAQGRVSVGRMHGSKSPKRKMASAMIAKIPLPLSRYIAAIYHPTRAGATPLNPKPQGPSIAVAEGGRTAGSIPATGATFSVPSGIRT